MKLRRVLVTGGAGFIGRWVVGEFLRGGRGEHAFDPPQVVVLDNLENGSPDNLAEFARDPRLADVVIGDITDRPLVDRLMTRHAFDLVLHLAAKINVQQSIDAPAGVFEADVAGTFHLLERARQAGAAFAFMSTCMVYSRSTDAGGIRETHPTRCASPYAAAKLAAEHLVEAYHHAYGLRTVTLRPFNTYGPFQKTTGEGGVVAIFAYRDLAGETLDIYGDGTQTRDLLYVEDCARFCVAAALADAAVGRTINAATGHDVTINDLAARISRDPQRVRHVPHLHPQAEIPQLRGNADLARRLLDWAPEVSLEDGIQRTRQWIQTTILRRS